MVIACAFNYEAQAAEFRSLGRIPILKARMNADLHMGEALKNTGKGNLFVVFGEPDISILPVLDKYGKDTGKIIVQINGVDVFYPNTGEIRSDSADGIACWFVDTEYNDESFFVRQAYFLGANDPYKALKIILKAEINKEAWESLHSNISRPFDRPKNGRIAVKVINHLGDKAYDSDKLDAKLDEDWGIEMIAPNRRKRTKTQDGRPLRRYRRRWKVERMFAWPRNFRRLVARYEFHAENFPAMAQLGCIAILLRLIMS